RMLRVGPQLYRGLADDRGNFVLPVVEVFTEGRWIVTDSYVYDVSYLAVAREAVASRGWRSGYGVHLDGKTDWDGASDALVMAAPREGEWPMLPGVYDDPQGFAEAMRRQSLIRWWWIALRNRLMSIRIHRKVRQLRHEAGG